jgi:acetoin utilization deacetylase AcuC-like enzyme
MSKPSSAERARQLQESLAYVKDLPGFERGHPHYFKDPMIDHLIEIVLQLGAELWVVKDRQMVTEHLLATHGKVTPEMIEQFSPTPEMRERLRDERKALTKRLYQCLSDEMGPGGDAAFVSGVMQQPGGKA